MKRFLLAAATAATIAMSIGTASAQSVWGADPVNRGLLNIFDADAMTCGEGWRFPVLIWGDRPVSACILKPRHDLPAGRQGGLFGDDFWFD